MNKIICEICGTIYPDTAEVCPICGYPKESSKTVVDDDIDTGASHAAASGGAARVKGGRYSNKNVKKRHQAAAAGINHRETAPAKEPAKASRGEIITVILLSVAIVLVGLYIGWRFIKGRDAYDKPGTTEPSTAPSVETTLPQNVPCEGLTISDSSLTFNQIGDTWWLSVTTEPANTTEEVVIVSSNESVVKVSSDGLIEAAGPGTATVTITCGDYSRICLVTCLAGEANTEPEETAAPTTAPTEPEATEKPTQPAAQGLVLSHTDATLFNEGESFRIVIKYNGQTVSAAAASFSNKDDSVATVEANGKVTAVGPGVTTVTVYYNGESAKCIVRCNIQTEETEETEEAQPTETPEETEQPEETEEPTEEAAPSWQISNSDVTLRVGEKFRLRITNSAGETADVVWSANKDGIVSVDGNTVTGLADGRVTLTATVDGQTFSCIVRVKN